MITLPASPSPMTVSLIAKHAQSIVRSEFTAHARTYTFPKRHWELELSFLSMPFADWLPIEQALLSAVRTGDTLAFDMRNANADYYPTPLTGAQVTTMETYQVSNVTPLNTGELWLASTGDSNNDMANLHLAGLIEVDGRLHQPLGPAVNNGGYRKMPVFPGLATAFAGSSVAMRIASPRFIGRLQGALPVVVRHHFGAIDPVTITLVETFG